MKLRLLVVFILLATTLLVGQTFRGTILGSVTDPSGAVVAGATVKIRNLGTGLERTTVTSADGSYNVTELPIGSYSVTVTQTGFKTFVATGVAVDVATERRVDAALKTGQVDTRVEVNAEDLPMVETTSNDLGGVITAESVEDMPVNGRDYTKLIYLNPGVAGSPDQISDSPGSFGEFSMNGARGRSNNYLLDGTDMNDGYRNDPAINQAGVFGTPATILPIDAVNEVNVLSNFQPEYGRNAGAVINIVTKSGANKIHGTAGEYMRNDALDARNYFNVAGQPKAKFHNNQFGASLGGPIIKDKTFYYIDYEGQQEPVGVVTLSNVPTGNAPDGSLLPTDSTDPSGVIPALLARHPWPAPNLIKGTPPTPGAATCGAPPLSPCPTPGLASVISPSYNDLTSMIVKIDQNFSASNILTGRYFFGDSVQSFPLALAAEGGELPGFNTFTPTRVQLASISYVHTFGTNKVNELRYGWNRFAEGFYPFDQDFHPSSIGMCAATSTSLCAGSGPFDSGLPDILVSGVAQLGASAGVPRNRIDSNDQVLDNFSWKMNKHDVKFGFDFHRTTVTQPQFDHNFRGRLSFNGSLSDGSPSGNAILDFLTGYVDTGFQYFGDAARHTYENNFGFYAQDSYRLTPHLTFNYGFRWDYFGVIGEKNNLLSNITNLDPTGETFTLTQVGQPGLSSLYNPDKKDFAPRLSIAWDVTGKGKTVVRAGVGMFYDASSQDMVMGHLPYSPYFDPGPAYNNAATIPLADQVLSTGLLSNSITYGSPLYAPTTTCAYECDSFGFDRNIKTPYMENYNLNIQQQITSKSVIQVGYVGSQGHRLWRFFDLSQPSVAQITASDCPNGIATCATTGAITASYGVPRNYIPNNPYDTFYLLQENSTGKSNYNALQVSYRVNGWHGMTSVVNFVWSRSMDNSSDGEDFEPNAAQPNDSNNPQLEYGPSNFNIPRRLTWNFSYEFPKRGGDWQRLKNGWGINSIANLQDGQPFQLNYNFEDDYSGGGNGFDRPDVVGPIKYDAKNPLNYLDLSSFAIPCTVTEATGFASDCVPGTRHYGDEGRDSLHGPTFKEWNFAIYKNTAITERFNMQFRADFFNILNHPNFANPFLPSYIADPGSAGFTTATVNNALREVGAGPYQISATGDVGIGNPFLGGGGPRGIQLALKFTF